MAFNLELGAFISVYCPVLPSCFDSITFIVLPYQITLPKIARRRSGQLRLERD
jgi:hypothetical protein